MGTVHTHAFGTATFADMDCKTNRQPEIAVPPHNKLGELQLIYYFNYIQC